MAALVAGSVAGPRALRLPNLRSRSDQPIENPLAFDTTWRCGALGYALVAGAVVASLASFCAFDTRSGRSASGFAGSAAVSAWRSASARSGRSAGACSPTLRSHAIALLALPVGTAVAILKYRLYELDLVVNRALVYGVMTVGVVAAYVVVVGLIGASSPTGEPRALTGTHRRRRRRLPAGPRTCGGS